MKLQLNISQNKQIESFTLVQCSDPNHGNCDQLREVISELPHVYSTYKTRFSDGSSLFCIAVKANLPESELKTLKKSIHDSESPKSKLHVVNQKVFQESF